MTSTPKAGRYVCFRRVTAYGWYTEQGQPRYASANEVWAYEQTGGGGGGGETEISKSLMTPYASGNCPGWECARAKDGLSTDPGWGNTTYTGTAEFLRIDLGSSHTIRTCTRQP